MTTWQELRSHEDASINLVHPTDDGGFWEARFVQRTDDYFIVYLSSHSGCQKACRFCHLTATGQTMMTPATVEDYLAQADQVLERYRALRDARGQTEQRMHYNFMARGEALSNPHFVAHASDLFARLGERSEALGLPARFLVSSILPQDFTGSLEQVFADERAMLYYSLYSVDERFRKRWLPKAMPAAQALDRIAAFQAATGREVALHWAFIEGENDSDESLDATLDAVTSRGIRAKFNLVRYNPHDARHGQEPGQERLDALFARIQERLPHPRSRIVPRVGHDVKASCGMFIEGQACA